MKSVRSVFLMTGAMFLIFGLVFMGLGMFRYSGLSSLMAEGESVQGVFTQVGKGNTWVEYEVDGQKYKKHSSTYSSGMRVGGSVTVWYPEGHPEQAQLQVWAMWGAFLVGGGLFILMGMSFAGVAVYQIMKKKSLMLNGTHVTAQITGITQNMAMRVNHAHPFVVRAKCIHPYTGQEMEVKSHFLLRDPSPKLTGGTVEVLVDPMRENRYYMLVDEE